MPKKSFAKKRTPILLQSSYCLRLVAQAGQRRTSLPFGALRFAVCLPSLVSGCVRLSRRRVRAPAKTERSEVFVGKERRRLV